jgi:hypothetical protein
LFTKIEDAVAAEKFTKGRASESARVLTLLAIEGVKDTVTARGGTAVSSANRVGSSVGVESEITVFASIDNSVSTN